MPFTFNEDGTFATVPDGDTGRRIPTQANLDELGGGGGGGVTVNSTPITNIVAAEAAIAGDEATVVTFPEGWSFNEDSDLVIDSELVTGATISFTSGVDPDVLERAALGVDGIVIKNAANQAVLSADGAGIDSDFTEGDINFHLKDEDGANDRHYRLLMGNARIELSYVDPAGVSPDNNITLDANGIKIGQAGTESLGFYGTSPTTQPAAIADATDPASTMASLNEVLAALRELGLIAP